MPDIIPVRIHPQETRMWYEQQYRGAKSIDVLGIACKDVISNLCGGHESTGLDSSDARAKRLQKLGESSLFRKLQKQHFDLQIILINPFCDFAKTRTEEEKNDRCRSEILESIEALERLCTDLQSNSELRKIEGLVEVSVIESNPYISLTRVTRKNDERYVVVGFLVPGHKADRYPKLLFNQRLTRFAQFFDMADRVFNKAGDWVFRWSGDAVKFNPKFSKPSGYDIFLCHNSRDAVRVNELRSNLRAQGIVPWMDRWEIEYGQQWSERLEEILPKVKCAAICIGPNQLGPWETMEINYLIDLSARTQTRLIPVILEGVVGPPEKHVSGFLKLFHWVDLRKGEEELQNLVNQIRSVAWNRSS